MSPFTFCCLLPILAMIIFVPSSHPISAVANTNSHRVMGMEMGMNHFFCYSFRVDIIDGFSSNQQPLLLHCWSKDQDLGNHTLYIGGDFNFHFRVKFLIPPFTHFACDMDWGQRYLRNVEVFDETHTWKWCCKTEQCYWRAQDDGLFFSDDNSSYVKKYGWQQY
ncbi:hypothetical protein Tsubulata_048166 [Turnera subulata]|uniref:S-protein homolog n=1 Tax=Turnera subulata TaxID=218843 RepID=A0A9Q0JKE5_9ROSI|nr:hypothetical protein Tsubulata_048166 [Turnera subulata]